MEGGLGWQMDGWMDGYNPYNIYSQIHVLFFHINLLTRHS